MNIEKSLMIAGALIFCAGILLALFRKLGLELGHLPGDISWQGKNIKVFIPFTSMILASIVLTVVMRVIARFFRH